MRVLVAPQEFKGSLSAEEAASAIAEGIRAACPEWSLDILPFSDGGPGFIDAVRRAIPAEMSAEVVHDALGRRVTARYLFLRGVETAVIEAAQANGVMHIAPNELDPLNADSYGVGELIAAALATRPRVLAIGVGGSATSDGGAGMARALGARLVDGGGKVLRPGGAALAELARIEWVRPEAFAGVEVVVATDVTNPLTGANGAAAVYGPQKGASPEQVDILEAALIRYGTVLRRQFGMDVASLPGSGAAGGLAAGLVGFLGARIESGFDWVARVTGLERRLAEAEMVITGEGRFDSQSLQGKVTGRILEMAIAAGKPCRVFAGSSGQRRPELRTLEEVEPDRERAMRDAAPLLTGLAAEWAAGF